MTSLSNRVEVSGTSSFTAKEVEAPVTLVL